MLIKKFLKSKSVSYAISFLIPSLTLFIYFAVNHFNLLTVDLGQQYVDLLAFLRQNLFHNPLNLIYSFQNGLGGSMLATDAYYLLSPLNLLLFLFPKSQLPLAILTIISAKFGLAGLTSYYYWQHEKQHHQLYSLATSLAYAMSGYMVANYFNLMWLDSVVLLPLLIAAIDRILTQQKSHLLLITFALWVTNFYSGIMALFFGFLYFLSKIFFTGKSEAKKIIFIYLQKSILATLAAAFILLPTFFELLANKASTSVNWTLSWQFNPLQELAKLADGAYSFHEMETGMPNIFLTIPLFLGVICYFLCQNFSWQKKLANGLVLIFLLLSLVFTPLVLIWHLGQFPVWYPGRFSFVLIFFCLNLALNFLEQGKSLRLWQNIIIGLISIGLLSYWFFAQDDFTFFINTSLICSTAFFALSLLFYFFIFKKHSLDKVFLLGIVTIEVIANLILSLNNLSFQENRDYTNFASNLNDISSYTQTADQSLFRTEKTFSRSDDDPFTANYYGLSSFNSITDQKVLNLLADLGYLHNSNSYTNNGGTLITDSILGVKYYLEPNYAHDHIAQNERITFNNQNERVDLDNYTIQKEFKQLLLVKNHYALPLIFTSPKNTNSLSFLEDEPAYNQQLLLQNILSKKVNLLKRQKLPAPILKGVTYSKFNRQYEQKKKTANPQITYKIPLKNNNSYYLQLPNGMSSNQVFVNINHQQINIDVRDDQNHLINVAHNQKGTTLTISLSLKQQNLITDGLQLYSLNSQQLNQVLTNFKKKQPKVIQRNALLIQTSTFSNKNASRLLTTIPLSKNWLIFDHGKRLKSGSYAKTFLAASLTKGQHQLRLIYIPWLFLIGILISLCTIITLKCFLH